MADALIVTNWIDEFAIESRITSTLQKHIQTFFSWSGGILLKLDRIG